MVPRDHDRILLAHRGRTLARRNSRATIRADASVNAGAHAVISATCTPARHPPIQRLDGSGRLISVTDPAGFERRYTYDTNNRLASILGADEETDVRASVQPRCDRDRFGKPDDDVRVRRARKPGHYLPDCGRFISEDPAGMRGGMNKYGYVSGDPINASDPYGLWSTNAHNVIIQRLFGSCFAGPDIAELMRGSLDVDGGGGMSSVWTQLISGDPAEHAMSNLGESPVTAERRMIAFIDRELALAESDPANWMFHLGRALHPLMDMTSPLHRNFAEWDPFGSPIRSYQHGENGPEGVDRVTPEVIGQVRDAIRHYAPTKFVCDN